VNKFRWGTNRKVLAENFMESCHLPVCHAATIGCTVDLLKMTCPEGQPAFNYHCIVKNDALDLSRAHPTKTVPEGEERRTTWLIPVHPSLLIPACPSLLITLSPGYFWYSCLTPDWPGHVNLLFGGGLAPEFVADLKAAEPFARLKALRVEVNVEDKAVSSVSAAPCVPACRNRRRCRTRSVRISISRAILRADAGGVRVGKKSLHKDFDNFLG